MCLLWGTCYKDPLTQEVREQAERDIGFAFSRFADSIESVDMLVEDVNGSKGGEDKKCNIKVRLVPSGTHFVEGMQVDLSALVHNTISRMAGSIQKEVDKRKVV